MKDRVTPVAPRRDLRERLETHRVLLRVIPLTVLLGVLLGSLWVALIAAPTDFHAPRIVTIREGMGLSAAAELLKEQGVVRSGDVFLAFALMIGGERSLIAGDYYFPGPQNAVTIATRLTTGDYELDPVKITLPEGSTVREMALILSDKLVYFDAQAFIVLADGKEGYLFPDTYYFMPTASAETIVRAMENNFYRRTEPLAGKIAASGRSLHEIVTMASLLEKEASDKEVRKMISGILWHRIDIGMRLQVDAVFPYIIGKNTFEVTMDDLMVDSPYNTYRYKGLPLGPIANPSLSSLEAAVEPTKSNYLFYLADMRGVTHYSRTYAEHLRKQKQYLGS
jgi:UPF0755 protein